MGYQETYLNSPMLCLKCAGVVDPKDVVGDLCPHCGSKIDRAFYEELFRYSYYAVRYGYEYRSLIDAKSGSKLEADGSVTKFDLGSTSNVLVFMGIAALSGIIGGAAYDLVKAALKKIQRGMRSDTHYLDNTESGSDDKLDAFINMMASYNDSFPELEDEVRFEIIEEIFADAATNNPKLARKTIRICAKKYRTKREQRMALKYMKLMGSKYVSKELRNPTVPPGFRFWENL